MSAFHVDGRISLKMEYELAIRLGEFINKMKPMDRQIAALGARLAHLDDQGPSQWSSERSEFETDYKDDSEEREMVHHGATAGEIGEKFSVSNSMRNKVGAIRSDKTNKVRWGY